MSPSNSIVSASIRSTCACVQVISDDRQQASTRAVCVVRLAFMAKSSTGGCVYHWQHVISRHCITHT